MNAEKVAVTCDSKSLNALMPMEMVNWMPQSSAMREMRNRRNGERGVRQE